MTTLLITIYFVLFGLAMFNLGGMSIILMHIWHRRRTRLGSAGRGDAEITKADVRDELTRDPVAMEMFMRDETPDDVQRYLYLEAERRAVMRKRRILTDGETDFFAPPRNPGPDPGFGHAFG